jgi:catechol 2,3-dioxygenase-like lactoylglutathione lyase family enzyme
MSTNVSVSHVGICVSDLERSTRFYCDGLGFAPGIRFDVGSEFAATLEIDGDAKVTSQFVSRDGLSIELLHYATGSVHGTPSASRNQLGFTHLSLIVDDVDAVAARLVEHGGRVVEPTRTRIENPDGSVNDFVFVADPDGVRVELMKLAGS